MASEKIIIKTDIEDYFDIGQKLNVIRLEVEDEINYQSYIKDKDENGFLIDNISINGSNVLVKPEALLEISMINNSGIWVGDTTVAAIDSGLISGLWVYYPDEIEKIQRRDELRLEFNFPVDVILKNNDETKSLKSECFNLSSSGIAISSEFPLEQNFDYILKYKIADINVESSAKFIHTGYFSTTKKYITGFKLLGLNHILSNRIFKIIIQKQLELRRKGLL